VYHNNSSQDAHCLATPTEPEDEPELDEPLEEPLFELERPGGQTEAVRHCYEEPSPPWALLV
jgi:hypothetical protein